MSRLIGQVTKVMHAITVPPISPGDAPPAPGAPLRIPIILAKGPYTMLRLAKQVQRNHDETKTWWREEVLDVYRGTRKPRHSAIDDLIDSQRRFSRSFQLHVLVRYQVMGAGSLLSCVGSWWENAGTRKALDTWIFEHTYADSGCA
ncbi:hypothetical protein [Mycobacterium sp.]|uniref:hypothetical protein n=1 Tax=Mycobacterium sp. TaxID=1785 RepID=UPI003BB1DFC2